MSGRVLFMHIPKSGGTTLDHILADGFGHRRSQTNIQFSATAEEWRKIAAAQSTYLSGHMPCAATLKQPFHKRLTILRDPLALLASRISFTRATTQRASFPDDFVALGLKYQVYREYFSPGFDLERMLVERQLGISSYLYPYTDPCSVDSALANLDTFDRVLDFTELSREIKRLVVEFGIQPPLTIAQQRAYAYTPPLGEATQLLSDFDQDFYGRAATRFRPIAEDLDQQYERYVERFCIDHGLGLEPHQTRAINLDHAVGRNWHAPETSEGGTQFRWSNGLEPTIDIPIRAAGHYMLSVYVFPQNVTGLEIDLTWLDSDRTSPMTEQRHGAVSVYQAHVRLRQPQWVVLRFRHPPLASMAALADGDERQLGLILSSALVRRLDR